MTDMRIEAMSKKKIKVAGFKEQINGWIKLYSIIMRYVLHESVSENGGAEAKAQLMRAIADTVKSDEMDKTTMGGIYYQPFSVCAEIPNKKKLHAFAEVENEINVKPYRPPEKLWQENEQELKPEDETKEVAF